jgi:hypothetical protein
MGSNHVEFMSGWKIYKLIPGVSNQREQPGTVIGLKTGTGKCVGVKCDRGPPQMFSGLQVGFS